MLDLQVFQSIAVIVRNPERILKTAIGAPDSGILRYIANNFGPLIKLIFSRIEELVQHAGEAPAKDPEGASAVRTISRFLATDLQGVKVLAVDDDPDARAIMRRVLSEYGAEVVAADSAGDALQKLKEFQPHVLVSDIGMPNRDGYDLIRHVRSHGFSFSALPAIALTAFARSDDRTRALVAGFQIHVAKPVDPSELTAAIATLVGRTGMAPDNAGSSQK